MKISIKTWQIAGFIFVSVFGVLLHFLYDLSGQSLIFSPFSAVNESIWEHMKILFFPLLLFALIQNKYIGESYNCFWCVKLIGTSVGVLLIPIIYYIYTAALGLSAGWFNISIFFISAAVALFIEVKLFGSDTISCKNQKVCFYILLIIAALFVVFTYIPPALPLFRDPQYATFGIG